MKRIWKDKEIAYIVEWGKNHKDRLKKYHKKWREKNPTTKKEKAEKAKWAREYRAQKKALST